MKKLLLIIFISSQLASAKSVNFRLFDTHINYKSLKDKYCQKNSKGEEFCSESSLTYPIIKSKNQRLNDGIRKIVKREIQEFKKNSAKEEVISTLKEMPDMSLSYDYSTDIRLYSLTKTTFTIAISSYSYTGGAHGNSSTKFYNYNTSNLKELSLDDIFVSGYKRRLKVIAEKSYRDGKNYMPNEDLKKFGWFNNQFELTENYAITSKTLDFLYNAYEIKPYSAGITEFSIPYSNLKSILKLKTPYTSTTMKIRNRPENKKMFKSTKGEIRVESKKLDSSRVELKLTMKNLSTYKRGWFSISLPQITSKNMVTSLNGDGFKTILAYGKGTKLYNYQSKKGVSSKYLLIEGEANRWSKNSIKTIRVILKTPPRAKRLYINIRGSFKTPNGIETFPSYGEESTTIEGQQGFINYRVKVDLK